MRNKRFAAFFVVAVLLASARHTEAAITRDSEPAEETLWSFSRNNTLAATSLLGGTKISARPRTVVRVTINVSSASGGGAGNTVIRVCIPAADGTCTGGTNVCSATFACTDTTTGDLGPLDATLSGSCSFPASARIVADVGTAGCTTTQPSIHNVEFKAERQ